ncbi:MAG: metallophosphoesterase [Thermomicrobium sp.]|nr:metallophosphoesterase [Thermomicrobium sp.]
MRTLRIVFSADFHGSDLVFRKFLRTVELYGAQALLLGGDLTGKALVPILKRNGRFEAELAGVRHVVTTATELRQLEQLVTNVGFYPKVMEPDDVEALAHDPQALDALFREVITKQITEWLEVAVRFLRRTGARLYLIPGNDDPAFLDPLLRAAGAPIEVVDGTATELVDSDYTVIGLGVANQTPWGCPRDWPEERIEETLRGLLGRVPDPHRAILLVHVPPYDSGLDMAPVLDEQLRIRYAGGQVLLQPVGSRAVRRIIEQFQPLLGLHGHIHESPGFRRIGRTLCVNVGSEYGEGILRAAVINLEDGRVKGYLPTSG